MKILFDFDSGKLVPRFVEIFVSLGIAQSDSGTGKVPVRSDEILVDPVPRTGVSSSSSGVDPVIVLGGFLHVSLRLQVVNVFKPKTLKSCLNDKKYIFNSLTSSLLLHHIL